MVTQSVEAPCLLKLARFWNCISKITVTMGKLLLTLTLFAFSSGVLCNPVENSTDAANSTEAPMERSDNTENDAASATPTNDTSDSLVVEARGYSSAIDNDLITFKLYTRAHRDGQQITLDKVSSITKSDWQSYKKTIVILPGYQESGYLKSSTTIRDAFLDSLDCNVIIADTTAATDMISYDIVAENVSELSDRVAEFINFMRIHGSLRTQHLTMVGFSVGAHVASLAAGVLKKSSPVAEVVALDPANPIFENKGPDGRVDRSQADHVQVIHTNAGVQGLYREVGTSDFYANGGTIQPGCESDSSGLCSHERSYQYYSESVRNPSGFPGNSMVGIPVVANMGGRKLDQNAQGYMFNFITHATDPFATVPIDD